MLGTCMATVVRKILAFLRLRGMVFQWQSTLLPLLLVSFAMKSKAYHQRQECDKYYQ